MPVVVELQKMLGTTPGRPLTLVRLSNTSQATLVWCKLYGLARLQIHFGSVLSRLLYWALSSCPPCSTYILCQSRITAMLHCKERLFTRMRTSLEEGSRSQRTRRPFRAFDFTLAPVEAVSHFLWLFACPVLLTFLWLYSIRVEQIAETCSPQGGEIRLNESV